MIPWRVLVSVFVIILSGFLLSGCNLPGQKDFSGLQVEMTDGSVGQVYLDELHYGQTPFEKRDIRPGTYTFRLEPEDNSKSAYETQIHLYPQTITSVIWSFEDPAQPTGTGEILELEPLASQERAELSVITVPEGAKISLDTQSYGLSPIVVESVNSGEYTLAIEAVAHIQKSLAIALQPGFRLHVFSRLSKEAAALSGTSLLNNQDSSQSADLMNSDANLNDSIISDTTSNSNNQTETNPENSTAPNVKAPETDIQTNNNQPAPSLSPGQTYVTITETGTGWLRVRDQASSAGAEVARVDVGNKYPYRSTLNGWYEIEYESGQTGWISGQYASKSQ